MALTLSVACNPVEYAGRKLPNHIVRLYRLLADVEGGLSEILCRRPCSASAAKRRSLSFTGHPTSCERMNGVTWHGESFGVPTN